MCETVCVSVYMRESMCECMCVCVCACESENVYVCESVYVSVNV